MARDRLRSGAVLPPGTAGESNDPVDMKVKLCVNSNNDDDMESNNFGNVSLLIVLYIH